jgi:hypothetical protein
MKEVLVKDLKTGKVYMRKRWHRNETTIFKCVGSAVSFNYGKLSLEVPATILCSNVSYLQEYAHRGRIIKLTLDYKDATLFELDISESVLYLVQEE